MGCAPGMVIEMPQLAAQAIHDVVGVPSYLQQSSASVISRLDLPISATQQKQPRHARMLAHRPDIGAQGQQKMAYQLIESGVAAVRAERANGGSSRS